MQAFKKYHTDEVDGQEATADPTRIELLRIELDEGEAEALVQAQKKNIAYFIGDDKRAREIGERQGLTTEPGGEDASKLVKGCERN